MFASKITEKGQATIPRTVRNILKVRPYDRISFHVEKGKVWLEGQKNQSGLLFGKYKHKAKRIISVEEMKRIIKTRAGR
jgi:bifunctional DNA-binding transcriptional regulator/antitoxin component of YhaV-PrlF toxin-antitoxin module